VRGAASKGGITNEPRTSERSETSAAPPKEDRLAALLRRSCHPTPIEAGAACSDEPRLARSRSSGSNKLRDRDAVTDGVTDGLSVTGLPSVVVRRAAAPVAVGDQPVEDVDPVLGLLGYQRWLPSSDVRVRRRAHAVAWSAPAATAGDNPMASMVTTAIPPALCA
jgi:hypothetical protein